MFFKPRPAPKLCYVTSITASSFVGVSSFNSIYLIFSEIVLKAWVRGAHEALKFARLSSYLYTFTALQKENLVTNHTCVNDFYLLLKTTKLTYTLLKQPIEMLPTCLFIFKFLRIVFAGLIQGCLFELCRCLLLTLVRFFCFFLFCHMCVLSEGNMAMLSFLILAIVSASVSVNHLSWLFWI